MAKMSSQCVLAGDMYLMPVAYIYLNLHNVCVQDAGAYLGHAQGALAPPPVQLIQLAIQQTNMADLGHGYLANSPVAKIYSYYFQSPVQCSSIYCTVYILQHQTTPTNIDQFMCNFCMQRHNACVLTNRHLIGKESPS